MANKKTFTVGRGVLYLVLIIITVATLLPLVWMVSASFKLSTEVFTVPIRWIPETFHFENYLTIWQKIPFALFTFNSFKLTIIVTLIQLLTCSFAAYGFTKCKFPGRDTLFLCYVATIAIPWQIYMLPQYSMMQKMGLVDTHLGYILMQAFAAFGVFLLRQFYQSIPNELLEAARIDGAGEVRTFTDVVLPMVTPGIGALAIFTFINSWNDYFLQLIMLNSTKSLTISLGIAKIQAEMSNDFGLIMAGAALASIPIIIVFVAFQKYFTQGIAMGAVKG